MDFFSKTSLVELPDTPQMVEADLVDVDLALVLLDEVFCHAVRADGDGAGNGFAEVAVDRRPGDRLQTLDLTSSGDVETLETDTNLFRTLQTLARLLTPNLN